MKAGENISVLQNKGQCKPEYKASPQFSTGKIVKEILLFFRKYYIIYRSRKPKLTAVGIRCAHYATLSIC
jgi:hypothetical protein